MKMKRFLNKKKTILSFLICCTLIVGSFSATYAYLKWNQQQTDTITIGGVQIALSQNFEKPKVITPGMTINDSPSIENTGNLPCFVRARVAFSNSIAQNECNTLSIGTNWEYDSNSNFYFYKEVLLPGKSTTPLFDNICVKTTAIPDDLQNLDVNVYSEAAQQGNLSNNEYKLAFTN